MSKIFEKILIERLTWKTRLLFLLKCRLNQYAFVFICAHVKIMSVRAYDMCTSFYMQVPAYREQ